VWVVRAELVVQAAQVAVAMQGNQALLAQVGWLQQVA
jgi:hypothetical protein